MEPIIPAIQRLSPSTARWLPQEVIRGRLSPMLKKAAIADTWLRPVRSALRPTAARSANAVKIRININRSARRVTLHLSFLNVLSIFIPPIQGLLVHARIGWTAVAWSGSTTKTRLILRSTLFRSATDNMFITCSLQRKNLRQPRVHKSPCLFWEDQGW